MIQSQHVQDHIQHQSYINKHLERRLNVQLYWYPLKEKTTHNGETHTSHNLNQKQTEYVF